MITIVKGKAYKLVPYGADAIGLCEGCVAEEDQHLCDKLCGPCTDKGNPVFVEVPVCIPT